MAEGCSLTKEINKFDKAFDCDGCMNPIEIGDEYISGIGSGCGGGCVRTLCKSCIKIAYDLLFK